MSGRAYEPRAWGALCDQCALCKSKPVAPVWSSNLRQDPVTGGPVLGPGPAHGPGQGFPPVPTPHTYPLVVVADAPGPQEVQRKTIFQGSAGIAFDDSLRAVHISHQLGQRGSIALLTAAVLCRPEIPGLEGKKRYDLKAFAAWLRKENVIRKRTFRAYLKDVPKANRAAVPMPVLLGDPFVCCYPRLRNEITWVEQARQANSRAQWVGAQPHIATLDTVVMPTGSFALASVQGNPGKTQSIQKYRGSVIEGVPL